MNANVDMTGKLVRREFLKTAGAVVAMGVAAGEAKAAKPWKMKLSTSSIGFSSLPIEEVFERVSGLGFEAIDIWSAHAGCPHLDDGLD